MARRRSTAGGARGDFEAWGERSALCGKDIRSEVPPILLDEWARLPSPASCHIPGSTDPAAHGTHLEPGHLDRGIGLSRSAIRYHGQGIGHGFRHRTDAPRLRATRPDVEAGAVF